MDKYFEEVKDWLTQRLVNHTYFSIKRSLNITSHEWCNEFTEFDLYYNDFEVLMLSCNNIELSECLIFIIQVPNTIEDLEKVLILLNAI